MKWEYKTLKFDFDQILVKGDFDQSLFENDANYLGWEGWELVNTFDTNAANGTRHVVAIFKRMAEGK